MVAHLSATGLSLPIIKSASLYAASSAHVSAVSALRGGGPIQGSVHAPGPCDVVQDRGALCAESKHGRFGSATPTRDTTSMLAHVSSTKESPNLLRDAARGGACAPSTPLGLLASRPRGGAPSQEDTESRSPSPDFRTPRSMTGPPSGHAAMMRGCVDVTPMASPGTARGEGQRRALRGEGTGRNVAVAPRGMDEGRERALQAIRDEVRSAPCASCGRVRAGRARARPAARSRGQRAGRGVLACQAPAQHPPRPCPVRGAGGAHALPGGAPRAARRARLTAARVRRRCGPTAAWRRMTILCGSRRAWAGAGTARRASPSPAPAWMREGAGSGGRARARRTQGRGQRGWLHRKLAATRECSRVLSSVCVGV
jgi:hypothetical protein